VQRLVRDALQLQGQAPLVFAVAAQVEQALFEHQRPLGGRLVLRGHGLGNPARSGDRGLPGRRIGPVEGGIDQQLRARGIETGMPLGHGQRGQGSGGEHFLGRVGIEPAQALGEGMIQRAQGACAQEEGEEVGGAHGRHVLALACAPSPPFAG
jgi:hypothetical protein